MPLLRELRRVNPEARIWVLTTETGREVLRSSGDADRVLVLDKRWDRRGVRSCARVLRELREAGMDAAVAAQRSFRTGWIVRLSGARLRIGFRGAPGTLFYNRRVERDPTRHATRRYLDLAGPLGGDPHAADPRPHLAVEPGADERVRRLLRRHGVRTTDGLLCVAPGSVWATKRWLPEGYAQVVQAAARRGLVPLMIGAAGDRDLCRRVAAMAGSPPVLAGETSIPDLVALVARARMVIANDSGAAHVASAVGTPVVSVFGSTVPELGYAAHGPHTRVVEHPTLDCRPCGRHGAPRCPLGHFRCMSEVRAEWVLGRMDELLEATIPPLEVPAMTASVAGPRVVPRPRARSRADQPRPGLAPG